MKNVKKGFSLIEILLILAITISIIIAAFYTFIQVSENNKGNYLLEETQIIISDLNNIYSDPKIMYGEQSLKENDYKMLLSTTLPPQKLSCGKQCEYFNYSIRTTPYKGTLSINNSYSGNPTKISPNVSFLGNDFSPNTCVKISSLIIKNGVLNGGSINAMSIYGNGVALNANTNKAVVFSQIVNLCNEKPKSISKGDKEIGFTFL